MRSRGKFGGSKVPAISMAVAIAAEALLMYPSHASATVDFSQDFETVASNSATSPATGYANFAQIPGGDNTGGFQIQGGSGGNGVSITGGVDSNGVGPSQALFATMDASQASSYLFFQIQDYNMGSAPTDAPAVSQVQVSFDMAVTGANPSTVGGTTSNLWSFDFVQGGLNAPTYSSTFTPTLAIDGSYTHVSFTLDEGVQSGTYSPSGVFSMQASALNGATNGYNYAAGDSFHLDNFVIQTLASAAPQQWIASGSGDWNVQSNWSGIVPNSVGAEADFFGPQTSSHTVYTDVPVTVGTINFNSPFTYEVTGTGNLTLQVSTGNAQVIVQQGTQEINLPTTLANNTTFNVAANSTLNIADPLTIDSGVTLTQTGAGTVLYTSTVTVQSNASIDFADSSHAAALNLASNATATVAAPVLEVDNLSNLGTLNIQNNTVIINYGSGADPISSIAAQIKSGYAGGAWTGSGIMSTNAQSNSSYGIGYADAADPGNPAGLASGQIEIMYTLLGDANLDHKVNGADFTLMAANFNDSVTNGWDKGDFNYSGTVNGDDFVLLAENFNQFAAQSSVDAADLAALDSFAVANGISLADTSSVPEPACFAMAGFAIAGCLIRRRKPASL